MTDLNHGPLDGIRVLDLTRVVAGPYCSMFLGDLGADVVKVEQPGTGDDTRGWGPPFAGGESAYFLSINRNKRSLALDLKSKRAVELLRQLVKVGVAIIDLVAGLMLGKAVTAALFAREKIGVGQRIDTSLLEAEVASLINVGSNYLVGGKVPTRWGNAHPNIVPYQNFKTADGYLVIGVASEVIWKRFCQAIGRPNLTDDARFANNSLRVENRTKLI